MVLFFSYKPLFAGYEEVWNCLHVYIHTLHIFFSKHFNIQLYNDALTIIYARNKHLFTLLLLWHLNNTLRYCLLQTVRRERRILNLPSLETEHTVHESASLHIQDQFHSNADVYNIINKPTNRKITSLNVIYSCPCISKQFTH
jgi:hypothetical protein